MIDSAAPRFDEHGKFLGYIGSVINIDDQKQTELKLRDLAERLVRSNRELQEFTSVASHDLQEPLRKILTFGDRLQTHSTAGLDEQGRGYLMRMSHAAGRMRNLINDLLAFTRVDAKGAAFTRVALAPLAHEVFADLEEITSHTGGQIHIEEIPVVMADATQMRQLLQNLIHNALKFHREDTPPVIDIQARLMGPTQNGLCEITLEDNGIGFDPQYADRIFNMFERLHGRTEYEGTGIGLAICRKIVERHNGAIRVESTPGVARSSLLPCRCDRRWIAQSDATVSAQFGSAMRMLRR